MKLFAFSSLRSRLITLVLVAVIPGFLFLFHITSELRENTIHDLENASLQYSQLVAAHQKQALQSTREMLMALADIPDVNTLDSSSTHRLLIAYQEEHPFYTNLMVIDNGGHQLCSGKFPKSYEKSNHHTEFPEIVHSAEFLVISKSDTLDGIGSNIAASFPIRNSEGTTKGYILVGLNYQWMNKLIIDMGLPDWLHLNVLDAKGHLLVSFPKTNHQVGATISDLSEMEKMGTNGSGIIRVSRDDEKYIYGFQKIAVGAVTLFVQAGVPERLATIRSRALLTKGLIWLGIATLIALFLAWFGGNRYILRKIDRIIQVTDEIAAGHLSARTNIRGNSYELNSLAMNLDRMAASIEAYERELQERENEFRALVENAPDVIGRFDQEYHHLYVNPTVKKFTGYLSEYYISKRHRDIPGLSDEFIQKWESGIDTVFQTGEIFEFQYQYQSGENTLYFNARLVPEYRRVGQFNTVLAIVRNITDRVKAEEQVKQREQEFRTLVEHSPDLIMRFDNNLVNLYVNPAMKTLVGLDPSEIEGKTMREVGMGMIDVSIAKINTWCEEMRVPLVTGESHQFEIFYQDKYLFSYVVPESFKDGEVQTLLCITRDVTPLKIMQEELQESQKLLAGIFTSLNEAVFVVNPEDRTIITCNSAVEKIFGYTPDELRGLNTEILHVNREKYEEFDQITLPVLAEKGSMQIEFVMRRKNGSVFPSEHTVNIMWNDQNEMEAVVSVVRDITERKRAESELKASQERLQNLARHLQNIQEEERQRISRDIHDELGQSLTALHLDLLWLQRKLSAKPDEKLQKKIDSMTGIIDQAIDSVQRISMDLRPGIIDDLGFESAIEWEVQQLEDRLGITCDFKPDDIEGQIPRDIGVTLYRILQEAFTNIARHAEASSVSVLFQVKSGEVILEVHDDGKGIAQDTIKSPQSFGINSMRERANTWNGEFSIKSAPNTGTTITVRIPLSNDQEDI